MTTQEGTKDDRNEIAPGFDGFVTPANVAQADSILERVGLRSTDRVLDVAAGSRAVSVPAARRRARVRATDIALNVGTGAKGSHD